jgi:hypothetical protein
MIKNRNASTVVRKVTIHLIRMAPAWGAERDGCGLEDRYSSVCSAEYETMQKVQKRARSKERVHQTEVEGKSDREKCEKEEQGEYTFRVRTQSYCAADLIPL